MNHCYLPIELAASHSINFLTVAPCPEHKDEWTSTCFSIKKTGHFREFYKVPQDKNLPLKIRTYLGKRGDIWSAYIHIVVSKLCMEKYKTLLLLLFVFIPPFFCFCLFSLVCYLPFSIIILTKSITQNNTKEKNYAACVELFLSV